jgi:hypothetical protein
MEAKLLVPFVKYHTLGRKPSADVTTKDLQSLNELRLAKPKHNYVLGRDCCQDADYSNSSLMHIFDQLSLFYALFFT